VEVNKQTVGYRPVDPTLLVGTEFLGSREWEEVVRRWFEGMVDVGFEYEVV
jgi:hypothetical protein